jgi:hypothetical protein
MDLWAPVADVQDTIQRIRQADHHENRHASPTSASYWDGRAIRDHYMEVACHGPYKLRGDKPWVVVTLMLSRPKSIRACQTQDELENLTVKYKGSCTRGGTVVNCTVRGGHTVLQYDLSGPEDVVAKAIESIKKADRRFGQKEPAMDEPRYWDSQRCAAFFEAEDQDVLAEIRGDRAPGATYELT